MRHVLLTHLVMYETAQWNGTCERYVSHDLFAVRLRQQCRVSAHGRSASRLVPGTPLRCPRLPAEAGALLFDTSARKAHDEVGAQAGAESQKWT